jgi:outer membrane protein assembly factor BamD (BamD/ComL family)
MLISTQKIMIPAAESEPKSFVPKVLSLSPSGSRIFSQFAANSMIPRGRVEAEYSPETDKFPIWNGAIFFSLLVLALLFSSTPAAAQAQRGTLVNEESIRISPGTDSAKVGQAARGYELVILDSNREWSHIEAIIQDPRRETDDEDDEEDSTKTITGWVVNKALVSNATPDGDKIIFGEAANSEDEASRRRGRRDAANDAMRLYYRVYDLFPNSPLAGESLYRAADIRWQMDRTDVMTRPSAREREAYMRGQINEDWMKLVIKKFPGSKWADLAAFHLIENKLCGDWQGASKCPEKEAEMYEKYVKEHGQSPAAAEALYDAVWRYAALIEIYKSEANQKKSGESKNRAIATAQRLIGQYGQSDWALRAQTLLFEVQQGVPTYGNASD